MALSVALLGAPAGAQSGACDALLREGVLLRRAHRDEAAWARFDRAWTRCQRAEALADRGLAALALERWSDGARDLEEALTRADDPFIRAWAPLLRDELERARTHLAHAAEAPPAPHPPVAPASAPRAPRREAPAGWLLGAGVSLAVGVASQVAQQALVARWNDGACLAEGRTRRENCAFEGDAADALQGVAVAGFVGAGALLAVAVARWVRGASAPATAWVCAPTGGGAACALRF